MSSKNVIFALESIISEYGNVEEIICENGKQFMAQDTCTLVLGAGCADWSFVEKTCEAKHEMQSVLKFSDVLFALKSDRPPGRGILWPRVVLSWVQLTWAQM